MFGGCVAASLALLACNDQRRAANAGAIDVVSEPRATRIVLLNTDGTSEDVGEHMMSPEALGVTEGSSVGGFAVNDAGQLVGVQLAVGDDVPGLDYSEGSHACMAVFADRFGRVVRVEALDPSAVPPSCNPEYTIVNNVIYVKCKTADCLSPNFCTLHKEEVNHETRYWCTCDSTP